MIKIEDVTHKHKLISCSNRGRLVRWSRLGRRTLRTLNTKSSSRIALANSVICKFASLAGSFQMENGVSGFRCSSHREEANPILQLLRSKIKPFENMLLNMASRATRTRFSWSKIDLLSKMVLASC